MDSLALPPQTANVRAAVVAGDHLLVAIESCTGEGVCISSIVDWLFKPNNLARYCTVPDGDMFLAPP